jgi:hypothetical protein
MARILVDAPENTNNARQVATDAYAVPQASSRIQRMRDIETSHRSPHELVTIHGKRDMRPPLTARHNGTGKSMHSDVTIENVTYLIGNAIRWHRVIGFGLQRLPRDPQTHDTELRTTLTNSPLSPKLTELSEDSNAETHDTHGVTRNSLCKQGKRQLPKSRANITKICIIIKFRK